MIRVFCRVLRGCLAFRLIVPHWILVLPLSSDMDLKSLIHDHSHFFDLLVDLIPARFYVPVPDNQERPWFHGLSKAAKASVKKESRENIKKARWARYNPENTSSTLDVLKKAIDDEKKSLAPSEEEKPCSDGDSGSDREAEVEDPHTVNSADRSVTYEELRNRLHRRIEELRGNRNTRTLDKPKNEKRDKRKKNFEVLCSRETDASQRKRKRDEDFGKEGNDDVRKKDGRAQAEDFSYGQVKLGGVEEGGKKMKKLSKQQELDKAKRLEDAKKDPEKGKIIADKHSWKAAMSRAIGGKVHDDPKVLQQSIKKEQKRHHKHAEKWKDRIESQSKAREEKQKTRTDNIRERIHQKKTRRIEKREKKLMRPGFEGRKDGYINE